MKILLSIIAVLILVTILSLSGCTRTYEAVRVDFDTLQPSIDFPEQAKAYLKNDNILVFENGFNLEGNFLAGPFNIYNYRGELLGSDSIIAIDSINAITQYRETTTGGVYFADALNILFGVPLTALAVVCLICPKCCFGSCPTVYTFSDQAQVLQAELFSKSISLQLEDSDLDRLKIETSSDGNIKLKITNEALETHYINKFNLLSIRHPEGTKVFQTNNNTISQINELIPVNKATSSSGTDISKLIIDDDELYFRSREEKFLELRNQPTKDFIEISANTRANNDKVKLLVKYRNTLLSTILLYDVVLGSQGIDALNWTRKMNEDYIYAMQFKAVYDLFSGISIQYKKNNQWVDVGKFQDAGPITWKYSVAEIPVDKNQEITIRLSFIPDNMMIDYIALDTTECQYNFIKEILNPVSITDFSNKERGELFDLINDDDEKYLVTDPGDNYTLTYKFKNEPKLDATFFIESKGYYNEWIRGSWLNEKNNSYTFNLFDMKGTFNQLVDSWIENKDLLEQEFFNSKIFLKEAK